MTAHKSKGLEFPVVILADMNSSLIRFDGGDRHVNTASGLAAQRLLSWAPHELVENSILETQRDTEEAWRIAYVAATRARDLLVVAATGDEIRQESWLAPLYPALYPRKGKWSNPALAPGCAFRGKDTVLQRPFDAEPEEILRPGLHEAGVGTHSIVWFDPSILLDTPDMDAGIDDDSLLRSTTSEPADGVREYEQWRETKARRLSEGASPELCVRRITEAETLPKGIEPEVEMIRIDASSGEGKPVKHGRKFGDLVHALLAHADYPVDGTEIEALAAAHEIGARMPPTERQLAIQLVVRTLEHPLLSAAFRAERICREYPVTYENNGELYEGVIDIAWFDGTGWTVIDYKTGPGDEPRYRRQIAFYREAIRKTTGAPARLIVLEIT